MQNYKALARAIGARNRCLEQNNDWSVAWKKRIAKIMEDFPHGSGFDSGTKLDDESTPERIVFNTAFHHMNENGFYDGWSTHQVIVTPSLQFDFSLRVTGVNRNQIKGLIEEDFELSLRRECTIP